MLENILKDFLGIDYRKEYKEINKGELREINLNDKADQAFIRCQFKKWLKDNQPKQLKLYTSFNHGYLIISESDNIDFSTLEGCNKIINRIKMASLEVQSNNEKIFGLK